MRPLVTIGIPNYNYARYLRCAVESALNQLDANVEVLVSDNASTDNSPEVLASIRDDRLVWWRNERNIGVYPNWDALVRRARGTYFKILQADDYLEPGFVRTCVDAMEATGRGSAFTGFRSFGDSNSLVLPADLGLGDDRVVTPGIVEIAKAVADVSVYSQPTFGLVRSDLIPEGFGGTSANMSRDMVYWAKAVTRGGAVFINEILAGQRIHAAQDRRRRDTSKAIGDMLDALDLLRGLDHRADPHVEALARFLSAMFARSAIANAFKCRWGIADRIRRELRRHGRLGTSFRDAILRPRPWRPIRMDEFVAPRSSQG